MALLDVNNLDVYYGKVKALENASFFVEKSEIVAMIGPNGAGKSTALKAIASLLDNYDGSISSGSISFNGKNIKDLRTDQLVKLGIAIVPEGRRVFHSLTVKENLEMGGISVDSKDKLEKQLEKVVSLFPVLKDRFKQKGGTLSGGEQQMLALGRALMLNPGLLLADEPSLGLSPNYIEAIFDKLTEIIKTGTAILLVEQNARKALEIAHRGYLFGIGKIIKDDSCENLKKDEQVQKAYLGG